MTVQPVLVVPSRPCEVRTGSSFGPSEDSYEVGEELGSGAASRVFACRRCRTGEQYAVKVVNIQRMRLMGDLATHMSRLDREVQILRQLRHERIVNLEDFHRTEDSYFLVMERVQGGELFNQIVLNKSLTELEARHVFRQLLEGVGYMHSMSIIHRDLKPENILIVRSRPAEQDAAAILHDVKIADFGLSKAISEGTSLAKTCVGTPQYWAPEVLNTQRSGGTYDHAADLWGLGAVLFVMLCGRYPFDGRKMPLDEQIRTAAFSMGTPKWRGISDSAKNLVRGLLKVDPSERLQLHECLQHPWVVGVELCQRLGAKDKPKAAARRRRAPVVAACKAASPQAAQPCGLEPVVEVNSPQEESSEPVSPPERGMDATPSEQHLDERLVAEEPASPPERSAPSDERRRLERKPTPVDPAFSPEQRAPSEQGLDDRPASRGSTSTSVRAVSSRSPSCDSHPAPAGQLESAEGSKGTGTSRSWRLWLAVVIVSLVGFACHRIATKPAPLPPITEQPQRLEPLGTQVALVPPSIVPTTTTTTLDPAEALATVLQGQAAAAGPAGSQAAPTLGQAKEQKPVWASEAARLQSQALQVPLIQLPGPGPGQACKEQETIFRLSELLKLQVSISGSLEMACVAFRHADLDLADATRRTFRQARDLFDHAAETVSRYTVVAQQVRETVLPDLRLAVEEQEPRLAVDLLSVVKSWVSNMKGDADAMRNRYVDLQEQVLHLVGRAQRSKLFADQRLAEAVQAAEFRAPTDGATTPEAPARDLVAVELQGGRDSPRQPDVCGSPTSGAASAEASSGLDPLAGGALSAPRSLNSLTTGLFEQLGRLSPESLRVGDALSLGGRGTIDTRDEETWKQNVIDLLFLAPGFTRLSLPPLESSNFSLDTSSSDGEKAVVSPSGAELGGKSIPETSPPLLGYSEEARSAADTASRSAASLLRALRELRRVDRILQGCSTFWANMDGTVERLAQMKDVTERLVGFATSSGRLRERFDQRLGEYADFWASLERLCRKYTLDHHAASARMQEFVREVADAADLIDTAESARRGAMAARWKRRHQRRDEAAER